jgi:hypothetical protein
MKILLAIDDSNSSEAATVAVLQRSRRHDQGISGGKDSQPELNRLMGDAHKSTLPRQPAKWCSRFSVP